MLYANMIKISELKKRDLISQISFFYQGIEKSLVDYDLLLTICAKVLEQIKIAIAACEEQNEIRILKGRYLENRNLTELGRELGLSVSRTYAYISLRWKKFQFF